MCLLVTSKLFASLNSKINRGNWIEKDGWSTELGQERGVQLHV